MNRKTLLLPRKIGFGLILLLLVSCATPSPATTLEFPTGTFVHEQKPSKAFQFYEDGTWDFVYGNKTLEGPYSVDGDLYTEETSNFALCSTPASYTWTYDGKKLTFHLFGEDECDTRKADLEGQTYIKLS